MRFVTMTAAFAAALLAALPAGADTRAPFPSGASEIASAAPEEPAPERACLDSYVQAERWLRATMGFLEDQDRSKGGVLDRPHLEAVRGYVVGRIAPHRAAHAHALRAGDAEGCEAARQAVVDETKRALADAFGALQHGGVSGLYALVERG